MNLFLSCIFVFFNFWIHLKCWIRIQWIRIHNTGYRYRIRHRILILSPAVPNDTALPITHVLLYCMFCSSRCLLLNPGSQLMRLQRSLPPRYCTLLIIFSLVDWPSIDNIFILSWLISCLIFFSSVDWSIDWIFSPYLIDLLIDIILLSWLIYCLIFFSSVDWSIDWWILFSAVDWSWLILFS